MAAFAVPDRRLAPCLANGSQSANVAWRLIRGADAIGNTQGASALRAWLVAHVFTETEKILEGADEPGARFREILDGCADLFEHIARSGFAAIGPPASAQEPQSVEEVTAEHYGRLFREFSDQAYWTETLALLQTRLERNGIHTAQFAGCSLLDAGCGGGRYSGAWRLMGAKPVVGVDFSEVNVETARQRIEACGLDGVEFERADVLSLPFEDSSFDVVFSNGVLHHTPDWKRGVAELLRVLKPGGFGWIYLIENPGGVFWDSIEVLRVVMRDEDGVRARTALAALGLPANRVFYMLDHVMAPINLRLTPDQVEERLTGCGAVRIRRLTRGADFDRIERIYRGERYAAEKVGVGENRYIFSKD